MSKPLFTPEQANRMLPLVRRIVEDILGVGRQMRGIAARPNPAPDEVREYNRLSGTLQDHLTELEDLGCSYKDWNFAVGLVDFPADLGGEHVLLCWRSDEPEVRHYHRHEDGYAGRKAIPDAWLTPPGSAREVRAR
jgi:hypothetical protein